MSSGDNTNNTGGFPKPSLIGSKVVDSNRMAKAKLQGIGNTQMKPVKELDEESIDYDDDFDDFKRTDTDA